jgi:hypothetical protein
MLTMNPSGPTLEEIARIFDGENAEVADVDIKTSGLTNHPTTTSFDEERVDVVHHEKS